MSRLWITSSIASLVLWTSGGAIVANGPADPWPPEPTGVVVESVIEGFAAYESGLLAGDILLRWERASSPPANPEPAAGGIESPFALREVEIEQAPRGEVTVSGMRGGETFVVGIPPGKWELQTRPRMVPSQLETYENGRALIDQGEVDEGLSLWRSIVFEGIGKHEEATWMFLRVAQAADKSHHREMADDAFEAAQREAHVSGDQILLSRVKELRARSLLEQGQLERATASYRQALSLRQSVDSESLGIAQILHELAIAADYRRDAAEAEDFFSRALRMREKLAPESLHVAASLNGLGIVAYRRGDLTSAEDLFRRSLVLKEKLVPHGLDVAHSLHNLGQLASDGGNLAAAESFYVRALVRKEKLVPDSLDLAKTLNNLGVVAWQRRDLAAAEAYLRRALAIKERVAPQSLDLASSLGNLGLVAEQRDDVSAAEAYYLRSLALQQELAPESLEVASSLGNLAGVAARRGDLSTAEAYYRDALALKEKLAPQSLDVARSLGNLAYVAFRQDDDVTAEDYLRRALEIYERLAPMSVSAAATWRLQGDVAIAQGELGSAAAQYERALAVVRELAPGSTAEAVSCQRLGALHVRRKQLKQALSSYDCAIEALEAQQGKLGGSDEVRSSFRAEYADYYRQAIDLLVETGKPERAFDLLERYRARELLALLVDRDLSFSLDLPEGLDRRRRLANFDYERAFRRWTTLSGRTPVEERERSREALEEARRRQDTIRGEVRLAAPRLAALQEPQPLDLHATTAALDPGTLLLSHSIGEERGYLFAVGSEPEQLRVVALAIGVEALEDEVEGFRETLARGSVDRRPERVLLQARHLSELLLAPARAEIERAERLLILADGPLHSLPFAALTDPAAPEGRRFLAEGKSFHLAASATVFALLKQERRERRPTRLTAFGDPQYTAAASSDESAGPQLRAALRSFELTPLPATRREVEDLRQLYPQTSEIFLGAEATEERAKAVDQATTHLHIASHGLLDDRFPLDSSLALSIPSNWQEGEENGLLQVWEIFEQVRLDADLVTLSACETGRGKVLGGEGLMGITRAFQYAGARSVLASQWSVSDRSTGELMKRFYGYLKDGQTKAEALRSAQLDLLRGSEFSHPFHWAGFQLVGDWR